MVIMIIAYDNNNNNNDGAILVSYSLLSDVRIVYLCFRYSFDYGSVHFIMMSTEHNFTVGSRQYAWLENDLRNVNRTMTPWVILSGHRAMYTSQKVRRKYILTV